ncbi:MAG: hypothetical protein ACI837_002820 [Crocinitomicaceae bacterium]
MPNTKITECHGTFQLHLAREPCQRKNFSADLDLQGRINCIFVGVKNGLTIALIGLFFLLTACPSGPRGNYNSPIQAIMDNGMDFPNLRGTYYNGIEFDLSDLFDRDYSTTYVLTDDALTRVIYSMDLNFSVELFDADAAETIQYSFDEELKLLDAVHDNYILKREESLESPSAAIKKPLPKEVGFPGYVQVVHGQNSMYGEESSYFTATLKINDEFFVFQLIGKKENMGYLYDDFIDLLTSVHT